MPVLLEIAIGWFDGELPLSPSICVLKWTLGRWHQAAFHSLPKAGWAVLEMQDNVGYLRLQLVTVYSSTALGVAVQNGTTFLSMNWPSQRREEVRVVEAALPLEWGVPSCAHPLLTGCTGFGLVSQTGNPLPQLAPVVIIRNDTASSPGWEETIL